MLRDGFDTTTWGINTSQISFLYFQVSQPFQRRHSKEEINLENVPNICTSCHFWAYVSCRMLATNFSSRRAPLKRVMLQSEKLSWELIIAVGDLIAKWMMTIRWRLWTQPVYSTEFKYNPQVKNYIKAKYYFTNTVPFLWMNTHNAQKNGSILGCHFHSLCLDYPETLSREGGVYSSTKLF